jgi:uncharacterized protein (DUF2147 family)
MVRQLNASIGRPIFRADYGTGDPGVKRRQKNVRRGWRCGPFSLAAAIAIVAAPILATASEPDPSGVLGFWLSSKKKVVVEIYPCEQNLCGKIVWLAKPYRKSGEFKIDKKNPDPALRARGWCGIEVITGLKPKRDDFWRNGRFYYPKKGKTYDVDIKLKDDDGLELRAYLGIRLLGKSEIWTRPGPDQTWACVPNPES